jgi:hypothetical protein
MRLLLLLSLLLLAAPRAAFPATAPGESPAPAAPDRSWTRPGGPRLRPQDDRLAMLLQEGLLRSASLRRLAERLEAGDVIVYLVVQPRLDSRLAGTVTWMGQAGGFRYLRASIAPHLPLETAITSIAHELAHATEILDSDAVTSERSLAAFYRRIGIRGKDNAHAWDTEGAMAAGVRVRRELRDTPIETVAVTVEPLSVAGWPRWYRRQLGS